MDKEIRPTTQQVASLGMTRGLFGRDNKKTQNFGREFSVFL